MVNKKGLASVPEVEVQDDWILANRIKTEYIVYAEIINIENNEMLLIYFFSNFFTKELNRRAAFRVFLTKDDYITQDLKVEKIKWLKSSINNLTGRWNWEQWIVCVNDETERTIGSFVGNKESALKGLREFQEQIMQNRLLKKHQVIIDKIDAMMNLVPELPEDFNSWINEEALYKSRYIFYQYKNGQKEMEGFCTYCLTDIVVEGPRHNQDGICPHCKSPITFKAIGKSGNLDDRKEAVIIQKVDGGFVVRYFNIYREYRHHYRKPTTSTHETIRDFYLDNKIMSYEWGEFKQSGKSRWRESKNQYYLNNASLYASNLDDVLKDTIWKYSAIKEFAICKHGMTFDVYNYLKKYKEYPFIEYLVKLRLYKLTHEITNNYYGGSGRINYEGNNLKQILKINKVNLVLLQKLDASLDELRLIQVMEEQRVNLSAEQIRYINENLGCATPLIEMTKYTTINKAINYIKLQAEELKKTPKQVCCHHGWYALPTRKSDMETAYQDWMDYIGFCKELRYDLYNEFVLYPKNLKEAHDREAELVQAKKEKEAAEKLKKQREKIENMADDLTKKFWMEYKGLIIMPPANADELKKEGNALHHCVGTYISRIADGDSIVLFIRKADKQDIPYCTIEIVNDKVYQCRGKFNADMTVKLKDLLSKFKREKLEKTIIRKEAV